MTVSDAFTADVAAARPGPAGPAEPAATRPNAARGRPLRTLALSGAARAAAGTLVADARRAWWMPASIPTLGQAWAQRMPDRARVPGDNPLLYWGWVVYNHTFGLLVPAAAVAVVGALTPLVWAARHPARLILTVLIAVPLTVLILQ